MVSNRNTAQATAGASTTIANDWMPMSAPKITSTRAVAPAARPPQRAAAASMRVSSVLTELIPPVAARVANRCVNTRASTMPGVRSTLTREMLV